MAFDGLKRLRHRQSKHDDKPGNLKRFTVHGSFKSKDDAMKRERETKDAFIIERQTKHGKRFIVMVDKRRTK